MDVELVARTSLSSLHREAEGFIVSPNTLDDSTWSDLRKQFKYKSLDKLYSMYHRRLQNGYLSLFVLLQLILVVAHCAILISSITITNWMIDVIIWGVTGTLLCPLIALWFRSTFVSTTTQLPVILSCLMIALLITGDLAGPVYYTLNSTEDVPAIRPVYATHTLLTCYIFLPLKKNLHAFILGVTASLCYIANLALVTYRNMSDLKTKLLTDTIYFMCLNCLGLYFRFMNEIVSRRSFLDRRKCVESTLRLNYEKDQEEQLTRSILPPHFAAKIKKDFRDIFKFIDEEHKIPLPQGGSRKNLYVETHDNVSILYADVVNFSGLTVTLPVMKLVETLNDLFGSFDEASERHNVLRIKFLGDCYYCVSGVPIPNVQHAKSCVDLGLDMIHIINEIRSRVRRECGVDVNMRIGVHSGKIISGILGTNKWQYDVWSRDVVIANKMEQTGQPGKVHVTQETLDLLDLRQYDCEMVDRTNDDILRKYGISKSYLITPSTTKPPIPLHTEEPLPFAMPAPPMLTNKQHYVRWNSVRPSYALDAPARSSRRHTSTISNNVDVFASSFRRRTHFMDNCLRDYHLMFKAADVEMEKAIEQMPLSEWECLSCRKWFKWKYINPLLLKSRRWNCEVPYLREPDPLFKFYIACAALVLLSMGLILCVPAISRFEWHVGVCVAYSMAMLFLVFLIPLTWMQFAWNRRNDPYDEYEGSTPHPRNKLLHFLYQTSIKVVYSEILRTALYVVIIITLATCALYDVVFECKQVYKGENNVTSGITETQENLGCVSTPWQMTENCSLAILTSFLFLRIHFILKLTAATTITVFYAWNVRMNRCGIFKVSETWNPNLEPNISHILSVIYLTFSMLLIDHQAEYLSKLDHQWKRQLTKEQDEAFHTRNANKLLLRNILPEHVAEFYLNMNRTEENYHESHECVAVMFASLTDLAIDESNILVDLNEIICQFDRILFEPDFVCRIEKIKLAGTTYMAACGLEASRRDSLQPSTSDTDTHVVKLMAAFAVKMIAVLDRMNVQSSTTLKPYKLRIGISHGEVTAGVVGSQKPLYDIWGDAVNMASRMDTTGVPGKIQVPSETASVLEQQGIECELRGDTWVKPKGHVSTYFVSVNSEKQLKEMEDCENTSL